MRGQVGRELDVRTLQRDPEVVDALLANVAGFVTEGRQRARRVASAAEERSETPRYGWNCSSLSSTSIRMRSARLRVLARGLRNAASNSVWVCQ